MRWFVLSDPSRDRLWGVCNTPLHGYENTMRWFALSDPYRNRLLGVCNTHLPYRMKKEGLKMFLWCFLRLKIESKCFWGDFWGSKSSQNVLEVLFEAQNRIKMFLKCFLMLKIEFKCFWGAFWGSKWSESVFEVYLLHKMEIKKRPGTFFWGVRPLSKCFESYMGLKT